MILIYVIYYIRSFSSIKEYNNHDVYALGEFKNDQFQGHDHEYYAPSDTEGNAIYEDMWCEDPEWQRTRRILSREDCGTVRYGETTHGKQVGVNYLIKAL